MRTVAYCGDYTALTTTHWGAKIYVDTRDTSLAPHLMMEGNWEPWVSNAIGTVLMKNPGATFIDVGANVGWYTLVACVNKASHVFAFDPNPRMVDLLRKTIAVNGLGKQVTLTAAACGELPCFMDLAVNHDEAGGAHLIPLRKPGESIQSITCRVTRLDDAVLNDLTAQSARFGTIVMKIDVEGFEPEVLAGATELLKLRPFIFLEHNPSDKSRSMLSMLSEQGYRLRHCQHSGHPGVPLTVEQAFALDTTEMIFCEPERL
jgi:FkbM family methyltransferase